MRPETVLVRLQGSLGKSKLGYNYLKATFTFHAWYYISRMVISLVQAITLKIGDQPKDRA